jgi:hypothetical protein
MSLDISHSKSHLPARAAEAQQDEMAAYEPVERFLLVLASGLAAIVISTVWVSLSLG